MRFASNDQSCEIGEEERIDFRWNGIIKAQDVGAIFGWVHEHCAAWSRMLWLWDMTETQLVPADSRRALLEAAIHTPLRATAVVTTDFYVRIPVTMVLEMAQIEMATHPSYRFCATHDEAVDWLRELEPRGDG